MVRFGRRGAGSGFLDQGSLTLMTLRREGRGDGGGVGARMVNGAMNDGSGGG